MADIGKVVCTPVGDWASGTSYEKIDIVSHDGATWISKVDNNSDEPSELSTRWLLIAKNGTDGTDGTDGQDGTDGNLWYRGTAISGKATTPTIYSGSGITDAHTGDNYLNKNEGAIYHCVTPGDASTATWAYDMTITGGVSDPNWSDIQGKPFTNIGDGLEVIDVSGVPTLTSTGGALKIGDVSGATVTTSGTSAFLTWSDPADIVVDGTTLAAWDGTVVVRKAGSAPASRTDGTVVVNNKVRNQYSVNAFEDTGLSYNTTYYYRFFPYTTDGAYTAGSAVSVIPGRTQIPVPVQSGSPRYTGSLITADFTNYDSDKMTVTGNTGTNAGTYTATFSLREGYAWNDGTIADKDVTWSIGNAVIDAVPTVSGPVIWTGSEVSPTWTGYDSNKMTISGDTAGTNTGTYTATFTPKTNYEWWDGTTAGKDVTWAIVMTIIENVPTQTGSLTYDGTAQAPTWLNYDDTKMSKSETAQTNAGSYSTTFTPLSGYCWSDGTVTGKTVSWSIAKATLTVPTLNAYNLTYDGTVKEVTFSNYDSSTMTVYGNTATAAGSHTATISIRDTVNYEWTDHTTTAQTYTWSIGKASLAIPTVDNTTPLVYTGSQQTASFNDYVSGKMTVSGNTGTNAGSYTATFSLTDTDNYEWYGGTITDKDVAWTIGKATQVITPASASVTLNQSTSSATVAFTQTGDGQVSVSSSDSTVATASLTLQYVVTISGLSNGTATITISAAASANYNAGSATISVSCEFGFNYEDWLDAASISASGYADLAAVLADEVALRKLMTIHDAVDYLAGFDSSDSGVVAVLNSDLAAKWITLRDYAEDALTEAYGTLMASIGKYGYGEWAKINNVWQAKGNVPVMHTNNTSPYGEAIASGQSTTGEAAWYAFNGVIDKGWASSSGQGTGGYIGYHFVNPVCVKRVWFANRIIPGSTDTNCRIKTFKVQASNDGTNWDIDLTDVITRDDSKDDWGAEEVVELNNNSYYLYYRVLCLSIFPNAMGYNNAGVGELQFYGRELKVSMPKMTNNSEPYCVADASVSQRPAYNATNPTLGSWSTTQNGLPGWLKYDLGKKVRVKKIILAILRDSNGTHGKNFKVWTSNDDNQYDLAYTGENKISAAGSSGFANAIKIDITIDKVCRYIKLEALSSFTFWFGGWLLPFGEDYTEYDWDQSNPQKYIYDHGVEPDGTLTLSGTATKEAHSIKLAAQNAQASKSLDVSSYSLMRGHVGQNASGTNYLQCGSGLAEFVKDYMPYNQSLDISSLNGSLTTGVKQTAAGTFECEEIWVE